MSSERVPGADLSDESSPGRARRGDVGAGLDRGEFDPFADEDPDDMEYAVATGGHGGRHGARPTRRGRDRKARRDGPRSLGMVIGEYAGLALVAVFLALLIRTFVGLAFWIPSGSMLDTLHINDRVAVSRVSFWLHDPNRGDVVVFRNPNFDRPKQNAPGRLVKSLFEVVGFGQRKDEHLIKRVVGLPGETIEFRDGKVLIDGRELLEPYLEQGVFTDAGPGGAVVTLGPKQYYMLGDNRQFSQDSRYIGPIGRDRFVGRAVARIWPPQRLSFL